MYPTRKTWLSNLLKPVTNGAYPAGSPMPSSSGGYPATIAALLVFCSAVVMLVAPAQSLIPGSPRALAKQSESLHNVKQLALGVLAYAQDYDDTFPGWVDNGTFPNGGTGYAHNTWDEQISGYIKNKDVFSNGRPGIKSPSDPLKQRVLTYGINGSLITVTNGAGQATFYATAANPPASLGPGSVTNPSDTILFAEIVADGPTLITNNPGAVSQPATGKSDATPSDEWVAAMPSGDSAAGAVIDISPRDWVQIAGKPGATGAGWWNEDDWGWAAASQYGVARSLHAGGGAYAFVDGHVKFMTIRESVGWGKLWGSGTIEMTRYTWANSGANYNTENKWYPFRPAAAMR